MLAYTSEKIRVSLQYIPRDHEEVRLSRPHRDDLIKSGFWWE